VTCNRVLLAAWLAATPVLAACHGNPSDPVWRAKVAAVPQLPPGWGRMRPMLAHAEALAALDDQTGLMAAVPALKAEGLGLLQSSVPNALPRHELARFLEARTSFGDALVQLSEAHEQGRAADLPALVTRLADAWRGWMSVISGRRPNARCDAPATAAASLDRGRPRGLPRDLGRPPGDLLGHALGLGREPRRAGEGPGALRREARPRRLARRDP
jgi:hypothetical protein